MDNSTKAGRYIPAGEAIEAREAQLAARAGVRNAEYLRGVRLARFSAHRQACVTCAPLGVGSDPGKFCCTGRSRLARLLASHHNAETLKAALARTASPPAAPRLGE